VWLHYEALAGGLAWTEPIGNREIGISAIKRFDAFIFAKPRNPIRDKARVPSQRSHRPVLSLED
jgi:hypothetical protein